MTLKILFSTFGLLLTTNMLADSNVTCTHCRAVQSPFGPEPIEPFFRYDVTSNEVVLSRWDFVLKSQCEEHRIDNNDCNSKGE